MLGFFLTYIALAPPTNVRSFLIKALTSTSIFTHAASIEPLPLPLVLLLPWLVGFTLLVGCGDLFCCKCPMHVVIF